MEKALDVNHAYTYDFDMNKCIFCNVDRRRILLEDDFCVVIADAFPVSDGHRLIIPRRHVSSFRKLNNNEWLSMLQLARQTANEMKKNDTSVTGFNFGFNDGAAAGQTVFHVHGHLIPRRNHDVPQPQGGIRWIFPDKACYRAS
jgi:diadenosine tetraphosphate (Ap4A) HIT family hydrolase